MFFMLGPSGPAQHLCYLQDRHLLFLLWPLDGHPPHFTSCHTAQAPGSGGPRSHCAYALVTPPADIIRSITWSPGRCLHGNV